MRPDCALAASGVTRGALAALGVYSAVGFVTLTGYSVVSVAAM